MKIGSKNNTFTVEESMKSIVYQLRIYKQKTANVKPFQAHFGRKPNTSLSNISTDPKSSNLTNEQMFNHYLDAATVPVQDYLDNKGWLSRDRSDILIIEHKWMQVVDTTVIRTSQCHASFYTLNL